MTDISLTTRSNKTGHEIELTFEVAVTQQPGYATGHVLTLRSANLVEATDLETMDDLELDYLEQHLSPGELEYLEEKAIAAVA